MLGLIIVRATAMWELNIIWGGGGVGSNLPKYNIDYMFSLASASFPKLLFRSIVSIIYSIFKMTLISKLLRAIEIWQLNNN